MNIVYLLIDGFPCLKWLQLLKNFIFFIDFAFEVFWVFLVYLSDIILHLFFHLQTMLLQILYLLLQLQLLILIYSSNLLALIFHNH